MNLRIQESNSCALPLGDTPTIDGKRVSKNHHKPRFATLVKSLSPVYSLLLSTYFQSSEQRPIDKVYCLSSDRPPSSHTKSNFNTHMYISLAKSNDFSNNRIGDYKLNLQMFYPMLVYCLQTIYNFCVGFL